MLAAVLLASPGCLDASSGRPADSRPVLTKDGTLSVRVERFRCSCSGPGAPSHFEGVVRARRATGPDKGTTAWAAPLDGEFTDAFGPTGADGEVDCALDEARPESGIVLVSATADGRKRVRKFRLLNGERID